MREIDVDPLTFKVQAALREVAEAVVRTARRTGTPIVVWKDGRMLELAPDELEWTPPFTPLIASSTGMEP